MPGVRILLHERYEVGRLIGRGGMAEVYLGRDLVLDRPVAVKVLAPPFDRDEGFVERFRNEARAAARLGHPNIVAVYDTGSQDGTHFIVMEHVEGPTLADVLGSRGPLDPERVADVGAQVADALAAAHRTGLVHRDVKPGNLMLAPGGRVKVVDLGIAKAADGEVATRSGLVMGTASYLAPEQARGDRADARSDVYSLGCVLYELATGRPPFEAESPVATLFQHVYEPVVPPSQLRPVTPALGLVIERCLEKDPDARYQDAADLAADLRAASGGTAPLPPHELPVAPLPPRESPTAPLPPDRSHTEPMWGPSPTTDPSASVGPPGEQGGTTPPRPSPSHRRRSHRMGAVPVLALLAGALVIAAVIGGLGLGLGGDGTAGRRAPAGTPGPATGTGTSPLADPVTGVPGAYAAFVETVILGQQNGLVSGKAADDLLHRAEDALKAYRDGDLEKALQHLDEVSAHRRELVGTGEIASAAAGPIRRVTDALIGAMRAEPPAPASVPGPQAEDHGKGDHGYGGHGNGD